VLSACLTAGDPVPDGDDGTGWDRCGASRLSGYAGQHPDTLDPQYLPQVVRLIRPGDAVTEDFSAARLNVNVGQDGLIRRFWCG
jgi:hypothetical protein